MCRIAGIVSRNRATSVSEDLAKMVNAIKHGGPDDEGTFIDQHVAMGHRRLAIIDLSPAGHQPMEIEEGELIVSFNGEIYNYKTLREELKVLGTRFRTATDTEAILHVYRQWGPKGFDRLQGIFAFSLYDKKAGKFFLVRDHVGVKPLYYHLDGDRLIFASEVKAFKALDPQWKENPDWRIIFLAFGSIPHPLTTLANVVQLSPGSYLELTLADFSHSINHYYIPGNKPGTISKTHEFLKLIHDAVDEAVEKNLVSDAPIGVFLSGGIDSSLLAMKAALIQKGVNTISVNFKEAQFDERPFQKLVIENSKGLVHDSYMLSENDFWSQLSDLWLAMDQPSVDGVNSYFVSKYAKNAGLKVVLSGLGADEIFGGYESINRIKWIRRFRKIPFLNWVAKIVSLRRKAWKRLVFLNIRGPVGDYLFLRGIHTPDSIAELMGITEEKVWQVLRTIHIDASDIRDDNEYASFLETNIYMCNQLLKDADYMSMWHGIEVRVPFLDIELIKKVQRIKSSLRTMKGWPKYLLTAATDNILPHDIVFRDKRGFTFPFALWMKNHPHKVISLIPETKSAHGVLVEFEKGSIHWSKCWSVAVIQQFKY